MKRINYRNICGIKVSYNNGQIGSSFSLPLTETAKVIIINRINDNEIKKIVIKKVKL
jgi:hypothetical protein